MADFYYNSKDILDKAIGTDAYFQIKSILTGMKAADVMEVRHGRWIWNSHHCKWECSECGGMEGECESPVCKWCGARMDKEDEHEAD